MKRILLLGALAAAIAAIVVPTASASVHVLPLSAQPNGWTYHQWHAIYNRRALERDFRSLHSLFAYRNGQCGQRVGQVKAWMLPFRVEDEGELTARCRVKAGTRLVVDIAGVVGFYGSPLRLKGQVDASWPAIRSVSLTLDGQSLRPHVIQTPFIHANIPYYNAKLLGVPRGLVSLVSRDYFAILSPLPRGLHTLSTSATYNFGNGPQTLSMTFHLNAR